MHDWTKRLVWLRPGDPENPFPIEVLDCRTAAAELSRSIEKETTSDAAARLNDLPATTEQSGVRFDELSSVCSIALRVTAEQFEALPNVLMGPDDRWRLTPQEDRIVFRRRWTGQIVHVAEFVLDREVLSIKRVTSFSRFVYNSPQYAVAELDFLLTTHLGRQLAPFPIPPPLRRKDVAKIALSGWKAHGQLAAFARFL